MSVPFDTMSVRGRARLAGALYLIVIVCGLFSEAFVRQRLGVAGDSATTAQNILANAGVYRLGFATGLVILLCNVPLALVLYSLFRAASVTLAGLTAAFILFASTIEAVSLFGHYAPLMLLDPETGLAAFPPAQVQAMAAFALQLHGIGFLMSLVIFAGYDLAIGALIWRTRVLPRWLGGLMVMAGLCYLVNSFALFLAPGFGTVLLPWILLPPFIGELSLALALVLAPASLDEAGWPR